MSLLKNIPRRYIFAFVTFLVFIIGLLTGGVIASKGTTKFVKNTQAEKIIQPDSDYKVRLDSRKNQILEKNLVVQEFEIDEKPLAIWYKPSTKTTIVVASEDISTTGNQILYVKKADGKMRKLYQTVSGEKDGISFNRHFYDRKTTPDTADEMYLTPNEEMLITREHGDYGYYPRVFYLPENRLTNYQHNWEPKDQYWSPTGRCFIQWGNNSHSEFGFFIQPYDLVSYPLYDNTSNREKITVVWESEKPCKGYVSMVADEFGGEGAPSYENKQYIYQFGEIPGYLNDMSSLPKNKELEQSVKPELKLIYVTYPDPSDTYKRYVSKSPEMCAVIDFQCLEGQRLFNDEHGCGCEQ